MPFETDMASIVHHFEIQKIKSAVINPAGEEKKRFKCAEVKRNEKN